MSSILPIQLGYPVRLICAYGYHFRSFTVHVSHRTTCGTTPRHIGPRGGKWVGLTPPPRIQVDLLSCVTITNSTHLTFVSAQFKQVCSLTSGRIYYTGPQSSRLLATGCIAACYAKFTLLVVFDGRQAEELAR